MLLMAQKLTAGSLLKYYTVNVDVVCFGLWDKHRMTADMMSSEGNIVFVPVAPQLQLFVNDCSKDSFLLGPTFYFTKF